MRSERGFALLAALWLLVALSVVGLEFGFRARERRLSAANVLESGRARAAADAGLADAHALLAELSDRPSRAGGGDVNRLLDPWAGSEVLLRDTVALGDARYLVSLSDAGAALNLNRADEEELRRLFNALRIDFGKADRLAQAIMDWQDGDDLHRARGAEREDYLREGSAVLPDNRPFDRLRDLRHVLGMTPEIYAQVRPHLTLLGTGQVNLNAASKPVLLALPGMTEQSVGIVLRRRSSSRPLRNLMELANELPTQPRAALQAHFAQLLPLVAFETREIIASSEGWADASPVHVVVTGLFARGGTNAFLVWRSVQ
jgi:general secretion pathway protein K